jgi:hypothetical protein
MQIEQSRSIKLPSIDMILVNSKRVQSELAKKPVLLRYLSEDEANKVLAVSGSISDFDDKTDQEVLDIIEDTAKNDYVLKPNR